MKCYIMKNYITGEIIGIGTLQELSEMTGKSVKSIYSIHKKCGGYQKTTGISVLEFKNRIELYKRLDSNTINNIIHLHNTDTIEEISSKLRIPIDSVKSTLLNYNLKGITDDLDLAIIDLYNVGNDIKDIANKLNYSKDAIYYRLNKYFKPVNSCSK